MAKAVYTIRIAKSDRKQWEREAKRDGRTLASFIIATMNARCRLAQKAVRR